MPVRWNNAFAASAVGALAYALLSLVLRLLANVPAFPELLVDRIVQLTPGAMFGFLIDHLQLFGRPLLYVSLLLGQLVYLTVLGAVIFVLVARRFTVTGSGQVTQAWATRAAILAALAAWLLEGIVILPVFGAGLFAASGQFSASTVAVSVFFESVLFAAVTTAVTLLLGVTATPADAPDVSTGRRAVTGGVGVTAVALLGGVFFWRYASDRSPSLASVASSPARPAAATPSTTATATLASAGTATGQSAQAATTGQSTSQATVSTGVTADATATGSGTTAVQADLPPGAVTPTAVLYTVSKNFNDPVVDGKSWRLTVGGGVNKSLSLTLDQLMAFPQQDVFRTFECISNDVGGDLIGNALWTGTPLSNLLNAAGLGANANFVHFRSADQYSESLPMNVAMDPTTLVVHAVNGKPLPPNHGYPARIVTSNRYGMKQPKWLTDIVVAPDDDKGFWEHQGWDEQAVVRTMSAFQMPAEGSTLKLGPIQLNGVAFAGARGISAVDVATSQGGPWQPAKVTQLPGTSVWARWTFAWTPDKSGTYQLTVRAVDGSGKVQDTVPEDSFPTGAAGLHSVSVTVQ